MMVPTTTKTTTTTTTTTMTTMTTTRTTTTATTTRTRTRTRTRRRRRTRSNNNNDDNNDNDDDDNDDDDNEDAARSMSCPQVQMKSPSLFPSPDPYRHRRCAKLYNMGRNTPPFDSRLPARAKVCETSFDHRMSMGQSWARQSWIDFQEVTHDYSYFSMIFSYLFATCHGDSCSRSRAQQPHPMLFSWAKAAQLVTLHGKRPGQHRTLRRPGPLSTFIFPTSNQHGFDENWIPQHFMGTYHFIVILLLFDGMPNISDKPMCWMTLQMLNALPFEAPWPGFQAHEAACFFLPPTGTARIEAGEASRVIQAFVLCFVLQKMMGWSWMMGWWICQRNGI